MSALVAVCNYEMTYQLGDAKIFWEKQNILECFMSLRKHMLANKRRKIMYSVFWQASFSVSVGCSIGLYFSLFYSFALYGPGFKLPEEQLTLLSFDKEYTCSMKLYNPNRLSVVEWHSVTITLCNPFLFECG